MLVETEATTELIELHLSYSGWMNELATHTPVLYCSDDPCPSDPWDYASAVVMPPVPKTKRRTVVSVSLNAQQFDEISRKAEADQRSLGQYLKKQALDGR